MNHNDATTTLQELKTVSQKFIDERNWHEPTSPKNMSMQLSIEAAELMEKFLWLTTEQSRTEIEHNRQDIEDEMSDVLFSLLHFCNATNIDIASAFYRKLAQIEKKYPAEQYKNMPFEQQLERRRKR